MLILSFFLLFLFFSRLLHALKFKIAGPCKSLIIPKQLTALQAAKYDGQCNRAIFNMRICELLGFCNNVIYFIHNVKQFYKLKL